LIIFYLFPTLNYFFFTLNIYPFTNTIFPPNSIKYFIYTHFPLKFHQVFHFHIHFLQIIYFSSIPFFTFTYLFPPASLVTLLRVAHVSGYSCGSSKMHGPDSRHHMLPVFSFMKRSGSHKRLFKEKEH